MPWYYVQDNFTRPVQTFCLLFNEPPQGAQYTVLAGPFNGQKDCVACQEQGLCGGSESASGSGAKPFTLPNKNFLCKSLQQNKYGRDVWALQCEKLSKVLAKDSGVKFGRDFYVAGGCGNLIHAKFMQQRRHNRDVYVYAEGCCDGGSSGSSGAGGGSSGSGSASKSGSSASSASSGSIARSGSEFSRSGSSTSGSITSGSQTGVTTTCCPQPLPTILYATISNPNCPQFNGTYELTYRPDKFVSGCANSQVWDNNVFYTPLDTCARNNSTSPPSLTVTCCDGVLSIGYVISALALCIESCFNIIPSQCDPLLIQLEVLNIIWYNSQSPGEICCTDGGTLITVTI